MQHKADCYDHFKQGRVSRSLHGNSKCSCDRLYSNNPISMSQASQHICPWCIHTRLKYCSLGTFLTAVVKSTHNCRCQSQSALTHFNHTYPSPGPELLRGVSSPVLLIRDGWLLYDTTTFMYLIIDSDLCWFPVLKPAVLSALVGQQLGQTSALSCSPANRWDRW